jgi:hypothetical protein
MMLGLIHGRPNPQSCEKIPLSTGTERGRKAQQELSGPSAGNRPDSRGPETPSIAQLNIGLTAGYFHVFPVKQGTGRLDRRNLASDSLPRISRIGR